MIDPKKPRDASLANRPFVIDTIDRERRASLYELGGLVALPGQPV